MKSAKKLFVAAVCGIVSLTTVFSLAACQGTEGKPGKSAYEIAVDNGFEGTEQEWLDSLKGADGVGTPGQDGQKGQDGQNGQNGTNGKSAYEIWKENGHEGTEEDFLNWLKGEQGNSGKSAYEIWKENGHEGTEEDFLNWLKGEQGNAGKSAYEIWKENGHEGTEEDFLEWLRGACDCEHGGGDQPGTEDPQDPDENVIHEFGEYKISAGETISLLSLYIDNFVSGDFYLVAETDTAPGNGKLNFIISKGTRISYDMFMPIANKFKVHADTTKYNYLELQNTSGSDITINNLKLVEYEAPTIEAGKEYDVQANCEVDRNSEINIAPELAGKEVTITISNWAADAIDPPEIWYGEDTLVTFDESNKISDGVYKATVTIPTDVTSLIFFNWNDLQYRNIVVRIDLVSAAAAATSFFSL